MAELPCSKKYFTDLSARITLPGFDNQVRWFDQWALSDPATMSIHEARLMKERNDTYKQYLARYDLGRRQPKWQVIRVHNRNHANFNKVDWWQDYQDCLFRVWMQPYTAYSNYVRDHVQHYILSPDDIYLTHCFERHQKGLSYPPRKSFKWVSPHKPLRKLRTIPVEVCKHFRHETTAGVLPTEEFEDKGLSELRL